MDKTTKARDSAAGITTKRSSKWSALEKNFLKQHPACAACGSSNRLNVHHIKPFHLHPELELEPTNLITLCMDKTNECHIRLGHGGDFKAYNPYVEEDVAEVKNNIKVLNEVVTTARARRLFE